VNQTNSTKENINKLIEFRQAIYNYGMKKRRDAMFELLDAILSSGNVPSFAWLSLASQFRRKWPSVYPAMEDGRIDSGWLHEYLAQQVPSGEVRHYALDGSSWPRPRARTVEDRQYVYQASSAVNGGTVAIGHPYSMLEWVEAAHSSWSLPVNVQRIDSRQTAQEVGAEQIQALASARRDCQSGLDVVACDGKYGNSGFLRQVSGLAVGIVVRLRSDRVLYRNTPLPTGKRGRPRVHGERFAFKDATTWGNPDEVVELEDPHWGRVRLERWDHLHEKKGLDVPYSVVRANIHLERETPPQALWLAWLAPLGKSLGAEAIWRGYEHRWPIEPGLHFRKQTLGWTQPMFQSLAAADRWTELTALAMWLLFLARPVVEDKPQPWQKPQAQLTPQRVQQSMGSIFGLIGSPAQAPKPRGIPPGWVKGRRRTPKPRSPVVKKTAPVPVSA
jgi:hypothetical protein